MKSPECQHCKHFQNSLFHFCHTEEIDEINYNKSEHPYKKGQVIFQEGSRPLGLYCIHKGKVKVYKQASDGKEQLTRIAKAGDFLGYSSFLTSSRYQISAAAMEDSEICLIPTPVIMDLFANNENFADGMVNMLTAKVRDSYERMADLAYKPVKGRLAEALLLLQRTYEDSENPEGIINISRTDLASLVGTVKETTIRILKEFKDDGLIQTSNSKIIIKHAEGLVQIGKLYD